MRIQKALVFLERHFEETIACIALSIISICVFSQVVLRYGFNTGLTWTEEVASYCMVWAVYMGASLGVRERFHIRIFVGVMALPRVLQAPIVIIADAIWFAFNILMLWSALNYLGTLLERPSISPGLGIDSTLPHSIIFIGYALMTVRLIQIYVVWFRAGRKGPPGLPDELIKDPTVDI